MTDDEGNELNPHLTRDGNSRAMRGTGNRNNSSVPLGVNPRFGRLLSEPKANYWPTMELPGTPAYEKVVDRILKLHQTTELQRGEYKSGHPAPAIVYD